MLGDREPRARRDEAGTGRDVIGALRVAAGADDVDRARRRRHRRHLGAHHARGAGQLLDRLAAHAQRHQEGAHLGGSGSSRRHERQHALHDRFIEGCARG